MKRKMTDLALAGGWGILGASGFWKLETPSAARVWVLRKPSLERRSRRPRLVKPAPACQMNSRRVRPQKEFRELLLLMTSLVARIAGASPVFVLKKHGRGARDTGL